MMRSAVVYSRPVSISHFILTINAEDEQSLNLRLLLQDSHDMKCYRLHFLSTWPIISLTLSPLRRCCTVTVKSDVTKERHNQRTTFREQFQKSDRILPA